MTARPRGAAHAHAPASPEWRPVARARAYELVVERIESQILSGALRVGDRLPAERDLAAMLGVSRAAVREAIRSLEAQGVVRSSVGAGREGGTTVAALPSEALSRFLRLHVALANFPMADVVEARITLERGSARLAARRRDEVIVARLLDLVAAMDAPNLGRDTFDELDSQFHTTLARAGGNALVTDLTTAIRGSMREPIRQSFDAAPWWEDVADVLRRGHHEVAAAVAAHDETAAADAVERHIRDAFGVLRYTKTR